MPNTSIDHYWKRRDICSCLGEVTTCRQWRRPCKGTSVRTFGAAPLACQYQCCNPLATCPRSERPKPAGRYTSTKFAPYFFHLSFAWNNDIINHCFGVCSFFTGLLRDIILYAIGLWNMSINYNSHSEAMSNKLLAKTISFSEHNLPQIKHCDINTQILLH